MRVIDHPTPHHQNMSAFPHQCIITDSSNGVRLLAEWATIPNILGRKKKNLTKDSRIGRTIRCWRFWDINYPGICGTFITSIKTNLVPTRLERWKARKSSHVKPRCNWIDFDSFGNMDKADDLPSPGTILPIRSQYSEGSRAHCLWSIFCRSSSKLHRPYFDVWWYVPLSSE